MTARNSSSTSAPRTVAVGRDPLLVDLADVVAHVRRVARAAPRASGCSPISMRSVPIMCATLSFTDQPGQSVGEVPLRLGEVGTEAIDVAPHVFEQGDERLGHAGTVLRGRSRATIAAMPEAIQFFFDPMCPYAYQTSEWIRDVRGQARARHHLAVLLARGDQPRTGQAPPVGTAVVVRLGSDARRRADPARAGQRRVRPVVRDRRQRVLPRGPQDARSRGARRGDRAARDSIPRSSSARSPTTRRSTTCAATTISSVDTYGAHGVPTIVFDVGLRHLRPRRRARAHRRRRDRALGPRARDAALPAPVRATPSQDARRPRPRRGALPDLPHQPRLEYGGQAGAVIRIAADGESVPKGGSHGQHRRHHRGRRHRGQRTGYRARRRRPLRGRARGK